MHLTGWKTIHKIVCTKQAGQIKTIHITVCTGHCGGGSTQNNLLDNIERQINTIHKIVCTGQDRETTRK